MKRFIKKIFLAAFLVGIVPIMDVQSSSNVIGTEPTSSDVQSFLNMHLNKPLAEKYNKDGPEALATSMNDLGDALREVCGLEKNTIPVFDAEKVKPVFKEIATNVIESFISTNPVEIPYVVCKDNVGRVYPSVKYGAAGSEANILKNIVEDLNPENGNASIETIKLDELVDFDMKLRAMRLTFTDFCAGINTMKTHLGNSDVVILDAARKKVEVELETMLKAGFQEYAAGVDYHQGAIGKFLDFIDFWYTVQTATHDIDGTTALNGISGVQAFIKLYQKDHDKDIWTKQSEKGLESMACALVDCYPDSNMPDDARYHKTADGALTAGKYITTASGIHDLLHFRSLAAGQNAANVSFYDVFRPTVVDAIIQLLFVNCVDDANDLHRDQINPIFFKSLNKNVSGDNRGVLLEGVTLKGDNAYKILGLKDSATNLKTLWNAKSYYIPTMMFMNKDSGYVTTEPSPVFIGPEIFYVLNKKQLPPVYTFMVDGTVYAKVADIENSEKAIKEPPMALISSYGTHLALAEQAATFVIKEISSGMGNNGLHQPNKTGYLFVSTAVGDTRELVGSAQQTDVAESDYAPYFGIEKIYKFDQNAANLVVLSALGHGVNCYDTGNKFHDGDTLGTKNNPEIGVRIGTKGNTSSTVLAEVKGDKKCGLASHSTAAILLCKGIADDLTLTENYFMTPVIAQNPAAPISDLQQVAVAQYVAEWAFRLPMLFQPENGVYRAPGHYCKAYKFLEAYGVPPTADNALPKEIPAPDAVLVGGTGTNS